MLLCTATYHTVPFWTSVRDHSNAVCSTCGDDELVGHHNSAVSADSQVEDLEEGFNFL